LSGQGDAVFFGSAFSIYLLKCISTSSFVVLGEKEMEVLLNKN